MSDAAQKRSKADSTRAPVLRRDVLLAAGAAALVALFARDVPAAGPAEACKPFVGTFAYAGGDTERDARDKAIDDVVADMNVLVRPIARDRLKSSNQIAATGQISCDGSSLTVGVDKRSYTAPLDGRGVKVKAPSGDELTLRYQVSDGAIQQTFSNDDGSRVNKLTLHDGNLVMRVRVRSPQLPKDLTYTLTYRRN